VTPLPTVESATNSTAPPDSVEAADGIDRDACTSNDTTNDPTDGESSVEVTDDCTGDSPRNRRLRRPMSPPQLALLIGMTTAVALAALIAVLGIRTYHVHQSEELRALYLQVGRQGALNITTIDWHHTEADVQRILGTATGTFYDDFSQRSQPFTDVVNKVQSTSTGTITAAGLESFTDTSAQVLVAVSVQTSTSAAPQQAPRAWRMRISLQKVGNDVKVSDVEFVP
jgi:Mce-associated membrane protein